MIGNYLLGLIYHLGDSHSSESKVSATQTLLKSSVIVVGSSRVEEHIFDDLCFAAGQNLFRISDFNPRARYHNKNITRTVLELSFIIMGGIRSLGDWA